MMIPPTQPNSTPNRLRILAITFYALLFLFLVLEASMRLHDWLNANQYKWTSKLVIFPTLLIVSAPFLFFAYQRRRRARRRKWHECLTCNYDLTGNTSGTCPECGQSASHVHTVICESCETPWTFPSHQRGTEQVCPECKTPSIVP